MVNPCRTRDLKGCCCFPWIFKNFSFTAPPPRGEGRRGSGGPVRDWAALGEVGNSRKASGSGPGCRSVSAGAPLLVRALRQPASIIIIVSAIYALRGRQAQLIPASRPHAGCVAIHAPASAYYRLGGIGVVSCSMQRFRSSMYCCSSPWATLG